MASLWSTHTAGAPAPRQQRRSLSHHPLTSCCTQPAAHPRLCTSRMFPGAAAATPPRSTPQPVKQEPEDSDFQGLSPEEDYEVPGSYFDALTSSTKLGKAVKAAVEELEHLGHLEEEVLSECDDLLKKLGMKGSLFGAGDNPMARLQAELEELEKLEQQELEKQQQQQQQQSSEQGQKP